MYLEKFKGNSRVKNTVIRAVKENCLAHGVLIMGERGTGVNEFSRLLAADITNSDIKQIENETNPSVQTIRGSGVSGQIKVSSIREINENVNFSSISGDRRVVIISNCENFNHNSANALLKNLEEPKDDITYILTTNNPRSILPTIRSRCSAFTLGVPSEEETIEYFESKGSDRESVSRLMSVYGPNIGKIGNVISDKKRADILSKATQVFSAFEKKDGYTVSKLLYVYSKDKDSLRLCLEDINDLASRQINERTVRLIEIVAKYRQLLITNANVNLAIENFSIECIK